ncbi:MAG: hypothetical protein SFX72_21770 [Isosphaeraceae bacterium]|nr:hypothetical protein [Isosphaeraceae bacterium]
MCALPAFASTASAKAGSASRARFRLLETGGLLRFGFPVHAEFDAPGHGGRFRLTRGGKPVPAQFRPLDRPGRSDAVALDFTTSVGPLGQEDYEVEFGPSVEPGPEPKTGLVLEREGSLVRVGKRSGLHWEFPSDLTSWLTRSADGKRIYADGSASELRLETTDGKRAKVGSTGRDGLVVDREGPLAIRLVQTSTISVAGGPEFRSRVVLDFVSSKSWIEVTWEVEDPRGELRRQEASLRLLLDGKPNLVDFGASSWVYEQLKADETTRFVAGPEGRKPRWAIEQSGKDGRRRAFAISVSEDTREVEGWAHVADATRCTAIAVDDFAAHAEDSLELGGSGEVVISREYPTGPKRSKTTDASRRLLRFWIHVVPTPVQVGALTSPQAILAPPKLVWGSPVG